MTFPEPLAWVTVSITPLGMRLQTQAWQIILILSKAHTAKHGGPGSNPGHCSPGQTEMPRNPPRVQAHTDPCQEAVTTLGVSAVRQLI